MRRSACFLLCTFFSASLIAASPGKVQICHHDYEGGFWTPISISVKAVDSHFTNHDDGYPNGVTSATGTELDENCALSVESCPCWTYETAMEVTTDPHNPSFCVVNEWEGTFYVGYITIWGSFQINLDVTDTWCYFLNNQDYSFVEATGTPEDFVGCLSIAEKAIEDSGKSSHCRYFP